jgi:hypothetical protein
MAEELPNHGTESRHPDVAIPALPTVPAVPLGTVTRHPVGAPTGDRHRDPAATQNNGDRHQGNGDRHQGNGRATGTGTRTDGDRHQNNGDRHQGNGDRHQGNGRATGTGTRTDGERHQNNGDRHQNNGDRHRNKGDRHQNNGDRHQNNGDRHQNNGDRHRNKGDRHQNNGDWHLNRLTGNWRFDRSTSRVHSNDRRKRPRRSDEAPTNLPGCICRRGCVNDNCPVREARDRMSRPSLAVLNPRHQSPNCPGFSSNRQER